MSLYSPIDAESLALLFGVFSFVWEKKKKKRKGNLSYSYECCIWIFAGESVKLTMQ